MPSISTNTSALSAIKYLNQNTQEQSDILSKIASGQRIVRASDDAAGLSVGTKLDSEVQVLQQASINASQGISVLNIMDGTLDVSVQHVERLKVLSAQSMSGSVSDTERAYIDTEFQAVLNELDDIFTNANYNATPLFSAGDETVAADFKSDVKGAVASFSPGGATPAATDITALATHVSTELSGGTGGSMSYDYTEAQVKQGVEDAIYLFATEELGMTHADAKNEVENATIPVGGATVITAPADFGNSFVEGVDFLLGTTEAETLTIKTADLSKSGSIYLDQLYSQDVSTEAASKASYQAVNTSLDALLDERASVGAQISQFEKRSEMIQTNIDNVTAAKSSILDADIATEQANLAASEVMTQASIQALSKANEYLRNLNQLMR